MKSADVPWDWTTAEEPPAPPLRDVLRPGPEGEAARRWHGADRAVGLGQTALLGAARALPLPWVSRLAGDVAGPVARWVNRDTLMAHRMDRTLRTLAPALDAAGRGALIDRWFANTARSMCEFPKLATLAAPPSTRVRGMDHVHRLRAEGRGAMILSVHTGMWEAISYRTSRDFDHDGVGTWQPQPNRYDNRMIAALRRRHGIKALPAGPALARRLVALLSEPGASLAMLIDEVSEGRTKFPLFGRPPERRSNLAFALKLAKRLGKVVLPVTMTRLRRPDGDGARFVFRYHAPWGVEDEGEAQHRLESVLGAHVRAHLDQWYMLHHIDPRELEAVSRPDGPTPTAR